MLNVEYSQDFYLPLHQNELFDGAYIRPLVYLGYGVMGLYHKDCPVQVSISAWKWGAYLGEEGLRKGIRLKISSMTRTPNTSGMGKAKAVANYLNSQMAKFEAVEAGYDEALLRDDQGYIAEASGACFFMVREGKLISPPSDNTLESITQQTVITRFFLFKIVVHVCWHFYSLIYVC